MPLLRAGFCNNLERKEMIILECIVVKFKLIGFFAIRGFLFSLWPFYARPRAYVEPEDEKELNNAAKIPLATKKTNLPGSSPQIVHQFETKFLSPASAKTSAPSAWNTIQVFPRAEDAEKLFELPAIQNNALFLRKIS